MLGSQTLTLLSASDGALDRKNIPTTVYTPTIITGCSIQPLDVKEDVTNIDFYLGKFNVFLPPTAAALSCKTTDYILGFPVVPSQPSTLASFVGDSTDQTYRVIGAKIWTGFNGQADHVTAVVEIPSGLNG